MDLKKFNIKFRNGIVKFYNQRIFKKKNSTKLKKLIYFVLIKIIKILDFFNIFSQLKFDIFKITMNYNVDLGFLQNLQIRRKKHNFVINCIGDSHVTFFSGRNSTQKGWPKKSFNKRLFFKSYYLGPVLAYNLCSFKTKYKGREKLLCLLDHILPLGSKVLFCFGEIDCRAHLLKQAEIRRKTFQEITRVCVDRYFSVIKETKEKGFEVLVFNVNPSGIIENTNKLEFPYYGTNLERNSVSKYFNSYLKQKLNKYNIAFISIFDKLVSENCETKTNYYFDEIHLSQKAMPFFLNELFKKYPDLYRIRK